MGRPAFRFEDQTRSLGKLDRSAESLKFFGRVLGTTSVLAFCICVAWMLATGDAHFLMSFLSGFN